MDPHINPFNIKFASRTKLYISDTYFHTQFLQYHRVQHTVLLLFVSASATQHDENSRTITATITSKD